MSFANNLKMECFYRGIFLKDLAEKIGVNYSTIMSYSNKNVIPRADIAVKIAKVLDVSVEYLVTGDISDISGIDRSMYPFMNDLKNVEPVFMDLLIRLIHELAKKKSFNS